jgi:hypothetical protein
MDGKLKAKIGKSDFFKDLVLGDLFGFSDTYTIKIRARFLNLYWCSTLMLSFLSFEKS